MPFAFSALPVDVGDAFLLTTGNMRYLFDGGIKHAQVTQQLNSLGVAHLEAVICSHNDADHANGIIGVLQSSIDINQVWIPGSWVRFLGSAAKSHTREQPWWLSLTYEILERWPEASSLRSIIQQTDRENKARTRNEHQGDVQDGHRVIIDSLHRIRSTNTGHLISSVAMSGQSLMQAITLASALKAGLRILKIAQLAINRNCKLRLFEYQDALIDDNVQGTLFTSVNSRELKNLPSSGPGIADSLFLTIVNRESLVFRHEHGDDGLVLFCADSDFSFLDGATLPTKQFTLATAPHHGSNDNRKAYARIAGTDFTWVRSDASATGRRPCQEFIKQQTRYCTICRGSIRLKQRVDLAWTPNGWNAGSNVAVCCCK